MTPKLAGIVVASILVFHLPLPAADGTKMSDLEAKIRALERRVDELEEALAQRKQDALGFERGFDLEDFINNMRRMKPDLGRGFNMPEDLSDFPGSSRPRMGVELAPSNDVLREKFKNDVKDGAFVMNVVPGSPAEKAGLAAGDAITSFNGEMILSPRDLIEAVKKAPNGHNTIIVSRKGEALALKVDLAETLGDVESSADFNRERIRRFNKDGWLRHGDGVPGANEKSRSRTEIKASALELTDDLARDMKLNEQQRAKMSEVLAKHRETLTADATNHSTEQIRRRDGSLNIHVGGDVSGLVEKHVRDAEKEMAGMLSPEQLKTWADYRARNSSISVSNSTVIESSSSTDDGDATGF